MDTVGFPSMTIDSDTGWTARRHEVIDQFGGVCALCARDGADTAYRAFDADDLIAAHTRCVVGLGPPPSAQPVRVAA